MIQPPRAAIFDLDETLAVSFQPPAESMLQRISALADRIPVAIMSGAGLDRILRDVVAHLPAIPTHLMLFPNSSSQCYMHNDGVWREIYSHLLTIEERAKIKDVLNVAIVEIVELRDAPVFGERIVDREAQIALACVGADAPREVKANWDPVGEKRLRIARTLKGRLAEFDILIGGASTLDITRKDMNKAFGVRWLAEYLDANPEHMFYVGDALFPGGNDEVVILTGVQTRSTSGPKETETIIDEILASLAA